MNRLRFTFFAFIIILGGLAVSGPAASANTTDEELTSNEQDDGNGFGKHKNYDDKSTFRGEDLPLKLDWHPCFEQVGPSYECATAHLPLDYDSLNGHKIAVELVRLPATGEKIGSLFLNPGGPGGSGIDFVLGAGPELFTPEVRAAYDLVGFDPRGVDRSTPLLCFNSFEEAIEGLAPFPFPTTAAERKVLRQANRTLQYQCHQQGGPIQSHMSTGNVARDLEALRAAVGDELLSFYGLSYGSVIGQVYGGLFPDNAGHIIIDGVIDIQDWVGPTNRWAIADTVLNQRIRSDLGAEDTFDEFLRLCDESGEACVLAPGAEARVEAVLDSLRKESVDIIDPATGEVVFVLTYAQAIGSLLGGLYSPDAWPFVAQFIADIELMQSDPAATTADSATEMVSTVNQLKRTAAQNQDPGADAPYLNFVESFPGVTCVDTSNPSRFWAWKKAARVISHESPHFGEIWTWSDSVCNRWPALDTDRFTGPFGQETANPILVMTTRYDPATSFEQAQSAAASLPNSSLVTVHGWGHTTLFTSACADQVVAEFLLNDVLAPTGTVCAPNVSNPFVFSVDSVEAEARAVLLEQTWMPGASG